MHPERNKCKDCGITKFRNSYAAYYHIKNCHSLNKEPQNYYNYFKSKLAKSKPEDESTIFDWLKKENDKAEFE